MAQLVKLQDYISRYQIDLTRYPTQFVRLKKNQWDRVKHQWQTGETLPDWEHIETQEDVVEPKEKDRFSFFKKLIFKRESPTIEEDLEEMDVSNELTNEDEIPEEETTLFFEPKIVYQPQTLDELKRMFIDQFFHFQLKWASSTLREKSYVDPRFLRDSLLRNMLQQLPDSYLVFYYPIIKVKKAPVELDIVLLTPTECICITVVEQENMAVYVGNSERFWIKKVGKEDKKMLNPLIQLNRMESIISQTFVSNNVEMPIRKVLLTRNGYIDYPGTVYNIQFTDKREFPKWFMQLKRSSSPMKHMQIRAAQAILQTVQTTSFNRDIWNTEKHEE
ncbi:MULTISPECIES: nuclease-related domain-containing protein [Lysinibacillus]|uniref:NERD domain-containing protein n=1 Tax=Lysinibacillus antri TaxID=2498145 RepID=A0A432LFT0_9BACI|nr:MULTISPECIES: nuclease-related domain-containing protein [Lysinibacillus]RUL56526.1 NERD domain-containing protein [Lysinibacillus antri]TSI03062.1 NERD domain-containing protein [Lysinibacillus sp. BW-2-10]